MRVPRVREAPKVFKACRAMRGRKVRADCRVLLAPKACKAKEVPRVRGA